MEACLTPIAPAETVDIGGDVHNYPNIVADGVVLGLCLLPLDTIEIALLERDGSTAERNTTSVRRGGTSSFTAVNRCSAGKKTLGQVRVGSELDYVLKSCARVPLVGNDPGGRFGIAAQEIKLGTLAEVLERVEVL
jgi:hypothetical protein